MIAGEPNNLLDLNHRLANSGFRFTPQRQHVYNVVQQKSHPTAEDVFIEAKRQMPDISMATVYNCLDALVKSGLVKQVNLDRAATRYCPNMKDHFHFYCESCGSIFDIDAPQSPQCSATVLPAGFQVRHLEIAYRGVCAACSTGSTNR